MNETAPSEELPHNTADDLWVRYAATRSAPPGTIAPEFVWGWYGQPGPGAAALGPVRGKTVLEIGCGAGRMLAHLVHHHGAYGTGLDSSPAMLATARRLNPPLDGLEFQQIDAVDYLTAHPERADVVFSRFGAADFTDPHRLLPAAAQALRPGGLLALCTAAGDNDGDPPDAEIAPRRLPIPLADGTTAHLERWILAEHLWCRIMEEAGLVLQDRHFIPALDERRPVATLLVTARRPINRPRP